jgi:polyferredoxin
VDVLRLPVVGPLLHWRHVRLAFQLVLLAVAAGVVLHGLLGPQIGPRNLATVLTSIHWRGLLVLAVLAAGNLFCAGCPMVLVRDAGRRFVPPRFSFPHRLRRKWTAAGLLVLVLFSYELFAAWELPAATAWIVLGYFALALVVDLLFKGASFCKHVCPIGQFNFVASTMAPAELKVRDSGTCHECRTYDCIKGRKSEVHPLQVVQRGCELGLFLPGKVGNIDCTLCLDCVHACPHDNIGLVTRVPGMELLDPRRRSGIGRLADRPDLAMLAIVFTFAALLSAFVMTAPALRLERGLAAMMNLQSEAGALGMLFVIGLGVAPALILLTAAAFTAAVAHGATRSLRGIALQYAPALIPFGFGVWLAHYGFHLFTGFLAVVPAAQSASIDLLGAAALGEPAWRWAGMPPGSVYPLQLGFVLLGACGSIGLVQAITARDYPGAGPLLSVPWLTVIVMLGAAALWILGQPMEMRGLGGIG